MDEATSLEQSTPSQGKWHPLLIFFGITLGLAVIQTAILFIPTPLGLVLPLSLLVSALFIAGPVLAIFFGSSFNWKPTTAIAFIVGGLTLQVALRLGIHETRGSLPALAQSLGNVGLECWCVGLGALLSTLFKEKNMVLPVALFLALLDIFLVLTPVGPTTNFINKHPETFSKIAYNVPKVSTVQEKKQDQGRIRAGAYVGPADWIFLGMFFVALFRFKMRTQETLRWMIPALIVYLLIVLFGFPALPAMLPIGGTVLLVNRKEFQLAKDEKMGIVMVLVIGICLIAYGITRPTAKPLPPTKQQAN